MARPPIIPCFLLSEHRLLELTCVQLGVLIGLEVLSRHALLVLVRYLIDLVLGSGVDDVVIGCCCVLLFDSFCKFLFILFLGAFVEVASCFCACCFL